jgi:hypothetical protein
MKSNIEHKKSQQIARIHNKLQEIDTKTMIKILCVKGYVTIIKCCANEK